MSPVSDRHILLVEDALVQRKQYAVALESAGLEVVVADCAENALIQARKRLPLIILSDYVMPDMDGVEFCALIRRDPQLKDVIFLIFTQKNPSEEEKSHFHDQPDGWIDKNLGVENLVATVKNWIVMMVGS